MAPVAWDANGVTGETGHLNSTNFLTVGGGSLRTKGASLSDPGVTIIVDAVPTALLQQDYDSGYRPGVDDWEFGITATANGQVPASAEGPTSLWYFLTKQGPPKLNGRFQQAAGVPLSDRAGLRWIATLDQDFQIDMVNAVGAAIGGNSNAQSDANQFNLIRANFVRDVQAGLPPRPQLVTITNTAGVPLTVVAYRVHGTQLFIYNPVYPGDATEYLEFLTGSAMTPIHLPPFVLSTFDSPLASGATLFLPIAKLPTTYAQVLDGTIGNSIFPTYQLHGWAGRLYDTLFVVDTLRWWVDCPTCAFGFPGVLAVPPVATLGGQDVYDAGSSTSIGFFTTVLANASPAPGTDRPLGAVTWSALSSDGTHRGWLDWHSYVLRRLQTAISPSSLNGSVGVPLSLTFQVAQNLLPSHVNYVWDFGDQQPAVTVVDNPVVQHPYAAAGTYPVTAKIIDVRNNQVIGLATTTATITAGKWQLTAFQQTALVTDPNYAFFEDSKTMNELRDSTIARPAGATLQVFAGGATLPMGIKEPSDFLVRADVNVAAPSMFLSFPRGLPSGGLLAEAVAATGAASSAALTTTPFCGPNCYPMIWINTFTQGGGTGAATYVGSAANWVLPLSNTISCPAPVVTPAKSPVEGYLEINATQSAGGLQGTITFVTPVIRNRTQGGPNICFWDTITEIRRTFTFTAVPAP
jgi:PKD repeat protein